MGATQRSGIDDGLGIALDDGPHLGDDLRAATEECIKPAFLGLFWCASDGCVNHGTSACLELAADAPRGTGIGSGGVDEDHAGARAREEPVLAEYDGLDLGARRQAGEYDVTGGGDVSCGPCLAGTAAD